MSANKNAGTGKGAARSRGERLEAQLRANLKRRKDQSRARAKVEPDFGVVADDLPPAAPCAPPRTRE